MRRYAQLFPDFPGGHAFRVQLRHFGPVDHKARTASDSTLTAGALETGPRAFYNQFALKFCECGQQVQH
jgi:hypothetical protein